jgi:hypothetical protein
LPQRRRTHAEDADARIVTSACEQRERAVGIVGFDPYPGVQDERPRSKCHDRVEVELGDFRMGLDERADTQQ